MLGSFFSKARFVRVDTLGYCFHLSFIFLYHVFKLLSKQEQLSLISHVPSIIIGLEGLIELVQSRNLAR